jgi:hypothetical protein
LKINVKNEKITTIAFILIVAPLLVFSQTTSAIPSATHTSQTATFTTPKAKQVNLDCMKNAVAKRKMF